MSQDLASEELKRHYATEIAKGTTFETHGVSVQAAKAYLDTPEGTLYWQRLAESDREATGEGDHRRAHRGPAAGIGARQVYQCADPALSATTRRHCAANG
jgi:hypothetical protein